MGHIQYLWNKLPEGKHGEYLGKNMVLWCNCNMDFQKGIYLHIYIYIYIYNVQLLSSIKARWMDYFPMKSAHQNRGFPKSWGFTPKSWILAGVSLKSTIHFGKPYFHETPCVVIWWLPGDERGYILVSTSWEPLWHFSCTVHDEKTRCPILRYNYVGEHNSNFTWVYGWIW